MISQSIKDGIRDGTAIGLSAGVLGLMYSLAALGVGLQPLEIIFYCAIVYSAAVQFTAFGADLNSVAAVLTLISGAAFVCTRNVLMSLDMARHATGRPIEIIGMVGVGARVPAGAGLALLLVGGVDGLPHLDVGLDHRRPDTRARSPTGRRRVSCDAGGVFRVDDHAAVAAGDRQAPASGQHGADGGRGTGSWPAPGTGGADRCVDLGAGVRVHYPR